MSVPTQQTLANLRNRRPVYDMVMPFDPNTILQSAQRRGMTKEQAQEFAHLSLGIVRAVHEKTGRAVTAAEFSREMCDFLRGYRQEEEDQKERMKDEKKRKRKEGDGLEIEMEALERKRGRGVEVEEVEDEQGGRRKRFKFSEEMMEEFFDGRDPYNISSGLQGLTIETHKGRDILSPLCENIEIATNIGKFLRVKDILNLYCTSKSFHKTANGHLLSTVRTWVDEMCPDAGKVFSYQLYKKHLVQDPAGRTWGQMYDLPGASVTYETVGTVSSLSTSEGTVGGGTVGTGGPSLSPPRPEYSKGLHETRAVPGMKYLQLVTGRSKLCSQILAILARNGHRTPKSMHSTLLKLWLLLEIPTSMLRQSYLRNSAIWTDIDLYNSQLLFIKLGMHFNDPIYGPNTYELLHLMLGQKGLYPLWQLLFRKKYNKLSEILELRVRYDFQIPPDHWGFSFFGRSIHGVPFAEIGTLHLEGWGKGKLHLMRPDEVIPVEAVRRGLELEKHLMAMVSWGYIDWKTGENLVPSEEEMYIEDEEEVLKGVDTHGHWKKRHVMKKRWRELSEEERQEIRERDEDERLRAMGWCGVGIDDYDSPYESDEEEEEEDNDDDDGESCAGLDDEIERGYILRTPPPPLDAQEGARPPGKEVTQENLEKWRDFGNEVLIGMPVSLGEDETLRAQGWWNGSGAVWEVEEGERREFLRGRGSGAMVWQGGEALFEGVTVEHGLGEEGEEEEEEEEEDWQGWEDEEMGEEEVEEDQDHVMQTIDEEGTTVQDPSFGKTEAQTHVGWQTSRPLQENTPEDNTSTQDHVPTTPPRKKSGFTPINSPQQGPQSTNQQGLGQTSIYDSPPQSPGQSQTMYGVMEGEEDAVDGDEVNGGAEEEEIEGEAENQGNVTYNDQQIIPTPMWTWPQVMDDEDGGYDSEASTVKMVSYE